MTDTTGYFDLYMKGPGKVVIMEELGHFEQSVDDNENVDGLREEIDHGEGEHVAEAKLDLSIDSRFYSPELDGSTGNRSAGSDGFDDRGSGHFQSLLSVFRKLSPDLTGLGDDVLQIDS